MKLVIAVRDGTEERLRIGGVVVKGLVAAEEDVDEHPDGPHIAGAAVLLMQDDLRREVGVGADHVARRVGLARDERQPEVGKHGHGVGRLAAQQHVLGLEVAVNDACAVHGFERLGQAANEARGRLLRVLAERHDLVEELAALHELRAEREPELARRGAPVLVRR